MFEVKKGDWLTEVIESDSEAVLVKFTAEWCGPCKQFQPVLEELAGEMLHVKFVTVDVDGSEELARANGIRGIPALVLFRDGEEVGREVGSKTKASVQLFIESS
jgi:thioredoxin 1